MNFAVETKAGEKRKFIQCIFFELLLHVTKKINCRLSVFSRLTLHLFSCFRDGLYTPSFIANEHYREHEKCSFAVGGGGLFWSKIPPFVDDQKYPIFTLRKQYPTTSGFCISDIVSTEAKPRLNGTRGGGKSCAVDDGVKIMKIIEKTFFSAE